MDRITRCTSEVPFYSQHVTLPFREMSCLVTARLAGARAWHHGWLSPPLKKPRGRLGVCHGGESVFWKHSINMHPPPPPQKWAVDTKWDLIQIVSNTDSSRAAVDLWTWTRALPSVCVWSCCWGICCSQHWPSSLWNMPSTLLHPDPTVSEATVSVFFRGLPAWVTLMGAGCADGRVCGNVYKTQKRRKNEKHSKSWIFTFLFFTKSSSSKWNAISLLC